MSFFDTQRDVKRMLSVAAQNSRQPTSRAVCLDAMPYLQAPRVTLHYRDEGQGIPVVLVHGNWTPGRPCRVLKTPIN